MKGKVLISPKGSSQEFSTEIVGKPERLHPILPKLRAIENQTYLRNAKPNHPILYSRNRNRKRNNMLRDYLNKPEEKQIQFTKEVEELDEKKLEEEIDTPEDHTVSKFPNFSRPPHTNDSLPKSPTKNRTHSKSPPTLANILRTTRRYYRGSGFYYNILESKFDDYSLVPSSSSNINVLTFQDKVSRLRRAKQDYIKRISSN